MAVGLVELCFNNKNLCLSDCLFVPNFKRNLVSFSCLVEHGLTVQFNSPVSIKSNNAFIYSGLLINGIYFLTHMSYSINAIENTDDEQFLYLRKGRFQMKPICGIYDWVILILVEFMVWLKVEF